MSRPARPDDVDAICADLPETRFGISWRDSPTWLVPAEGKGRGFVLYRRPHSSAVDPDTGRMYDDLLVVVCPDLAAKEALVQGEGPFFTIEHFDGYAAVLVQQSRLGELDVDELREVISEAWCAVAPKRLVREFRG